MKPEPTDSRIAAVVEHLHGLPDDQARAFLERLRLKEPDLHDEVLLALDPPTAAPGSDRTSDLQRRAVLTATAGPHVGGTFTCSGPETFTFGRSRRARFSFPNDSAMSTLHFMLSLQPGMCLLTDLASSHGTFVNGGRIEMTEANHGDEIRAGNSTFRLLLEGGVPRPSGSPKEARTRLLSLPGYELLEELGRGGMGVVFKARRAADGETVAVKMIRPDRLPAEEDVRRFRREMRLLQQLRHPHVVGSFDVGEDDGRLFLVMEYVAGGSLGAAVKQNGPLPVGRAVTFACQVLEGLSHAHLEGVVHRDIKPANVLVAEVAGREVAKLGDFGLARAYQSSGLARLTRTGQQMGTPAFMPREQVTDFRTVSAAADQYSAAATLYYLLTGAMVYDGIKSTSDVYLWLLEERPTVPLAERRADLAGGLTDAVRRALSHRPDERFADVAEFRLALVPFAAG